LLKSGDRVELVADLGGGKTTLVRGLARGAGSKDAVASPTFTLNKIYKAKNLEIHHFDFYRLSEPGIIADQLRESLQSPKVVVVVEWGQIVADVLPEDSLVIKLEAIADNPDERIITVQYDHSKTKLIKQLETAWVGTKP